MSRIFNKSFFVLTFLLTTVMVHAKQGPPPPAAPPVGAPIDGNILIMAFVFLLFGFYKIYRNKYTKTSN